MGDKVDWGRVPFFGRGSRDDGHWAHFIAAVLRRPWTAMLVSAGALLILALPALSMHTKLPNLTDLPHDLAIVRTYDRLQHAFPGSQTPAVVVVKAANVDTPQMRRAYNLFRQRALASGQLFAPFTVSMNPDKTVARIDFAIAGNGDNKASFAALHTLRDKVIPPIAKTLPVTDVAVTGVTAGTYDFNHQMLARLPWVFLFVLGLAFSLLLLTFRSLVIAATAVVLNLLSVGAAYGILVAVFQHGWLAGPLGFQTNGAIVSWLPLFLFVVLFGLSMDYHVFILSRVKELHDAGATTDDAIRLAITRTAGTVTSAAIIMVAIFGLFASLSLIMMQQMGFGLAIAVLIDATVVRAVLVPSTMKILGEWNWYLPRWLEWLPTLTPEDEQPPRHPDTRYRTNAVKSEFDGPRLVGPQPRISEMNVVRTLPPSIAAAGIQSSGNCVLAHAPMDGVAIRRTLGRSDRRRHRGCRSRDPTSAHAETVRRCRRRLLRAHAEVCAAHSSRAIGLSGSCSPSADLRDRDVATASLAVPPCATEHDDRLDACGEVEVAGALDQPAGQRHRPREEGGRG